MINPYDVAHLVEKEYYLEYGTLHQRCRLRHISDARAIAQYLLKVLYGFSWHAIAAMFNNDHTSIIHNCKKVVKALNHDTQNNLAQTTIKLIEQIREMS